MDTRRSSDTAYATKSRIPKQRARPTMPRTRRKRSYTRAQRGCPSHHWRYACCACQHPCSPLKGARCSGVVRATIGVTLVALANTLDLDPAREGACSTDCCQVLLPTCCGTTAALRLRRKAEGSLVITGSGRAVVVVFRPPAGKELNCQLATQLFPNKDASETHQFISKLNICGIYEIYEKTTFTRSPQNLSLTEQCSQCCGPQAPCLNSDYRNRILRYFWTNFNFII
jgi:hypothetical protein